jgi:lipoate-protein ligase B
VLKEFETQDWGLVDYDEAFSMQEKLVKLRQDDAIGDTIVFCRHPSVVTLGRSSVPEDLIGWSGKTVQINRGGRATYHGPGQIVIYPIIKLKENSNIKFRNQDVRHYLESLEAWALRFLSEVGVNASVESGFPLEPGQLNRGIWSERKKIASIGIAIKKWVTMHGMALNLKDDPKGFSGIMACGFQKNTISSLEELGVVLDYKKAVTTFLETL